MAAIYDRDCSDLIADRGMECLADSTLVVSESMVLYWTSHRIDDLLRSSTRVIRRSTCDFDSNAAHVGNASSAYCETSRLYAVGFGQRSNAGRGHIG